MDKAEFEWDPRKNDANIAKHGVSSFDAQRAFLDKARIIAQDFEHSGNEIRHYCFGKVDGAVMTVRFIPQSIENLFFTASSAAEFEARLHRSTCSS